VNGESFDLKMVLFGPVKWPVLESFIAVLPVHPK
jgi:hypothetical protein